MTTTELVRSKKYTRIDQDECGEYIIEFRLNTGRGTAPVRIPIKHFGDIISILEAGPAVKTEENDIVGIIRNSLLYDIDDNGDEVVIFRTCYGRGSKIQKIRKIEYEQVINALKELSSNIPGVISKYEDLNR